MVLTKINDVSSFSFILIFSFKLDGGVGTTTYQPGGNTTFQILKDFTA